MKNLVDTKIFDKVTLQGKITEIIYTEKEVLYKVIINEKDPPNSFLNEILIRGKDIIE